MSGPEVGILAGRRLVSFGLCFVARFRSPAARAVEAGAMTAAGSGVLVGFLGSPEGSSAPAAAAEPALSRLA